MMSASEYRTRAGQLLRQAGESLDGAEVAEFHRLAQQWLRLAELADWQETMRLQGHGSA